MGLFFAKRNYRNTVRTKAIPALDRYAPGWWLEDRIDLDVLDIASYNRCVLGQLAYQDLRPSMGYARLVAELGEQEGYSIWEWNFERVYGFDLGVGPNSRRWKRATEVWREEITRLRRERGSLS